MVTGVKNAVLYTGRLKEEILNVLITATTTKWSLPRWWVCHLTLLRPSFCNTRTLMYQIIMLYTIFWVSFTSGKLEKEISGSWCCFMVCSRWGYVYGRAVAVRATTKWSTCLAWSSLQRVYWRMLQGILLWVRRHKTPIEIVLSQKRIQWYL